MILTNKDIVLDTDPRVRQKSEKVAIPLSEEDKELLLAMRDYVKNSQDEEKCEEMDLQPSVGIAAIQVGVPKKMIAIVVEDENGMHEVALANPRIVSESVQNAYIDGGEGCLSVKGEHPGHVFRHARVKVKAYDLLQEKDVTIAANGYFAIVLQHEIDHLSGKLFYDRIDENDPWKEDEDAIVY